MCDHCPDCGRTLLVCVAFSCVEERKVILSFDVHTLLVLCVQLFVDIVGWGHTLVAESGISLLTWFDRKYE